MKVVLRRAHSKGCNVKEQYPDEPYWVKSIGWDEDDDWTLTCNSPRCSAYVEIVPEEDDHKTVILHADDFVELIFAKWLDVIVKCSAPSASGGKSLNSSHRLASQTIAAYSGPTTRRNVS